MRTDSGFQIPGFRVKTSLILAVLALAMCVSAIAVSGEENATPGITSTATPVLTQTPGLQRETPTPTPQPAGPPEVTEDAETSPVEVLFDRNHVNPGAGEKLKVDYELKNDGPVVIRVFGLNGELIKVLEKQYRGRGRFSTEWDGRNEIGNVIGRGIYFVLIQQGEFKDMKKVVVIK